MPEARVVGGAVRDTLAGKKLADVDLAAPLSPDEVMARLTTARIKSIPTGIAHGTVTALVADQHFEITTLRRDVKTDGRHALVAFTDDWQEDASRRDFTINAMSMDRNGRLFDYFGGVTDLRAGVVRFVGDAKTRIAEDYLRIMRFFRFFARYAVGAPDTEAVDAIEELRDGVLLLSAERVWSELKRILAAAQPVTALQLMQTTGVLERVLPEGFDIDRLAALIARGAPLDIMLRAAALLAGEIKTTAAQLKLSNEEAEILQRLQIPNTLHPTATDADLRRALANDDAPTLIARTWFVENWESLRTRLAATPRPVFPLQGRDLTELGIPQGPRIGKILAAVRRWWMENGCTATREDCRAQALLTIIK
ncbi:MAG TPA: CCA tRNA nucleotidyltransferase [Acidocella sp.]|nr:MAG: poly(A) polymerase [Acidocella sp. 21-58-7]HQU05493.1 CCA tRNA nucleotidyltransferase [Acidocella sp.]